MASDREADCTQFFLKKLTATLNGYNDAAEDILSGFTYLAPSLSNLASASHRLENVFDYLFVRLSWEAVFLMASRFATNSVIICTFLF